MDVPLVVTLMLDESAQYFFDTMRKEHFPKHFNYLNAHCTLFHSLPAGEIAVKEALALHCKRPLFSVKVNDIQNMGNGVAYSLESDELQSLRLSLQQNFKPWLNHHDCGQLKSHITVQNKVSAFKALTLFKKLRSTFEPFEIKAIGISTWLYLKGPWKHREDYRFID